MCFGTVNGIAVTVRGQAHSLFTLSTPIFTYIPHHHYFPYILYLLKTSTLLLIHYNPYLHPNNY